MFQYDPQLHRPVMYSSICTGEKRIGFERRADGHFEEVACVRSEKDMDDFLKSYGLREEDIQVKY